MVTQVAKQSDVKSTTNRGICSQQHPTSQEPQPTNSANRLLVQNARALFSPLQQSLHTHVFMGPPLARRPKCSCWKQAQPAVVAPPPRRPLIPNGYHDWVVDTRNGKWRVKNMWKACAMPSTGLCKTRPFYRCLFHVGGPTSANLALKSRIFSVELNVSMTVIFLEYNIFRDPDM